MCERQTISQDSDMVTIGMSFLFSLSPRCWLQMDQRVRHLAWCECTFFILYYGSSVDISQTLSSKAWLHLLTFHCYNLVKKEKMNTTNDRDYPEILFVLDNNNICISTCKVARKPKKKANTFLQHQEFPI